MRGSLDMSGSCFYVPSSRPTIQLLLSTVNNRTLYDNQQMLLSHIEHVWNVCGSESLLASEAKPTEFPCRH